MNTKKSIPVIVSSLVAIGIVLVLIYNNEMDQSSSYRTSHEIYQDFLDSKAREKIIFEPILEDKIHGDSEINKNIQKLEDEIVLRKQLFEEYSNLPFMMQTEPNLDEEIFRIEKYGNTLQGNWLEILQAQKEIERNFRITMEKNGCDACPIYSVSILGDGSVLYKGLLNVKEMGKKEYVIPVEDVTELISLFYEENRSLKTQYGSSESNSSVITTIELGYTVRITNYGNAGPEPLKQLEDKIDEIAKTKQFLN
jgi:hypothetical protein